MLGLRVGLPVVPADASESTKRATGTTVRNGNDKDQKYKNSQRSNRPNRTPTPNDEQPVRAKQEEQTNKQTNKQTSKQANKDKWDERGQRRTQTDLDTFARAVGSLAIPRLLSSTKRGERNKKSINQFKQQSRANEQTTKIFVNFKHVLVLHTRTHFEMSFSVSSSSTEATDTFDVLDTSNVFGMSPMTSNTTLIVSVSM